MSTSLPLSTRSATVFGGALARATGLASYLSGCIYLAWQRCVFHIAAGVESFHGFCLQARGFPDGNPDFVPPRADFDRLTVPGQLLILTVLVLQ